MCEPTTIAFVAAIAISATASVVAGQNAKNTADFNAKVQERNAIIANQNAQFRAARFDTQFRRLQGSQRAAFAKAGVGIEGSPLDVLADTAAQGELQRLAILHAGAVGAESLGIAAEGQRFLGAQRRTQGFLGAGATILGGAAQGGQLGIFGGGAPTGAATSTSTVGVPLV